MTTNQTIDGVPRAALMTVLSEPRPDAPHCVLEARAVLCALLDAPVEPFKTEGWSIDHSADRPILVHNNCSVIEAEQAYGLLDLINAAAQPAPVVVTDEQILQAMRPSIYAADGGYVWDMAPQDVLAAGRAVLALLSTPDAKP